MQKMNPEVKELWIDRLESGDIPQTTSKLGTEDGARCCLGVLCDIAVENNIIGPPIVNYGVIAYVVGEGPDAYFESGILPPPVMKWAGLDDPRGSFGDDTDDILTFLNDSGSTFSEIAQVIREKL